MNNEHTFEQPIYDVTLTFVSVKTKRYGVTVNNLLLERVLIRCQWGDMLSNIRAVCLGAAAGGIATAQVGATDPGEDVRTSHSRRVSAASRHAARSEELREVHGRNPAGHVSCLPAVPVSYHLLVLLPILIAYNLLNNYLQSFSN